jgi:hypothetical protein
MTDDDKKLVEMLRDDDQYILVEGHNVTDWDSIEAQRFEAADRIEALIAENEKLREALQGVTPPSYFGESEQNKAWWAKARAALEEKK